VKINLNSPDRYPASADLRFVKCFLTLLQERGIRNLSVGVSSGLAWQPTAAVIRKKGLDRLTRKLGIRLINFDEEERVDVAIQGPDLKKVAIPKAALEADQVVYLPNVKTHQLARFSIGLKFAVGLLDLPARALLHESGRLEEAVVQINLAVRPDLIVADGRVCMVSGGPARGKRKRSNVLLASNDLVALDVEALKLLRNLGAPSLQNLSLWALPQILSATRLGLGSCSEADYVVVTGDER